MPERQDRMAAHDVHNHLAVILGFAQLCIAADDAGQPPERAHLEGIARAAAAASAALRSGPGSADGSG